MRRMIPEKTVEDLLIVNLDSPQVFILDLRATRGSCWRIAGGADERKPGTALCGKQHWT